MIYEKVVGKGVRGFRQAQRRSVPVEREWNRAEETRAQEMQEEAPPRRKRPAECGSWSSG